MGFCVLFGMRCNHEESSITNAFGRLCWVWHHIWLREPQHIPSVSTASVSVHRAALPWTTLCRTAGDANSTESERRPTAAGNHASGIQRTTDLPRTRRILWPTTRLHGPTTWLCCPSPGLCGPTCVQLQLTRKYPICGQIAKSVKRLSSAVYSPLVSAGNS